MRAALGHSYNGYYSGLLIRQIRVRIPGGPLKIWLRRLNRLGRWSRLPARSLLNACQRARSNLSRQKCRVQIPSELLVTPHLTKQVQVATLSMWRYGFESRWGLRREVAQVNCLEALVRPDQSFRWLKSMLPASSVMTSFGSQHLM